MSLSKNDIKFIRGLHQKKNRSLENLFLVEGEKLVQELISEQITQIQHIYYLESCSFSIPSQIKQTQISSKDLKRISALKTPNQVLAIVKQFDQEQLNVQDSKFIILLDNIKDPGNLGTILRTADWFGADAVICSETSVERYNPKVVQASMGAIFRIKTHYTDLKSFINILKENNFNVFGASMEGEHIFKTNFPTKTAIVLGSESHGLSAEIANEVKAITIPQFGKSESLNVAIAGGVIMSEVKRQNS